MKTIRIATRNSPLALWQAAFVRDELMKIHQDLSVEIIGMTTKGDQLLDTSLSKIGGKGLFVKELEHALLENRADIAVHSMKDVGVMMPEGLTIACIMARHNPLDALVSNQYQALDDLPDGSVVGTCSLRRICQLQARYPNWIFKPLRGNIHTRLQKLDAGEYDAIILAAAGLERMDMEQRISQMIPDNIALPAIAQGTLGIEIRANDSDVESLLLPLQDNDTLVCTTAERAVNERLNGSCQTPIAAYATLEQGELHLRALIGQTDGSLTLTTETKGQPENAHEMGIQVAETLLAQGADKILSAITI